MNILFTVCGRAGSKGVKNKNIRPFLGKPLVTYTLSQIKTFSETYGRKFNYNVDVAVNSDSKELLEIAKKFDSNIIIVERKKNHTGDFVSKMDVIKHSHQQAEKISNTEYDLVIDVDITSPLRTALDIKNVIDEVMKSDNYDAVFTVVNARRNPFFNMVMLKNNSYNMVIENDIVARQEAPLVYDMNASIYAFKRPFIIKKDVYLFDGVCGIVKMKDYGVIDIDSEEDFELMEVIYEHVFSKNNKIY